MWQDRSMKLKAGIRLQVLLIALALIVVAFFFSPILFTTTISQTVQGRILNAGAPVSFVPVRLSSGSRYENCMGKHIEETVTDAEGFFTLHRRTKIGHIAVMVEQDALCIQQGGTWTAMWQEIYGPATATLEFACDLAKTELPSFASSSPLPGRKNSCTLGVRH